MKNKTPQEQELCESITKLLQIMAKLRAPDGCPWDKEQNHSSIAQHAVEEAYELIDAVETGDDDLIIEELGDLLLQVIFHSQLALERNAFNFQTVVNKLTEKLVRRHPHVFGSSNIKTSEAVLGQWEKIKKAEKLGTKHQRDSVFDGIPKHLPSLMKAEKLIKKAHKIGIISEKLNNKQNTSEVEFADRLFELIESMIVSGLSPEKVLRQKVKTLEKQFRQKESNLKKHQK